MCAVLEQSLGSTSGGSYELQAMFGLASCQVIGDEDLSPVVLHLPPGNHRNIHVYTPAEVDSLEALINSLRPLL